MPQSYENKTKKTSSLNTVLNIINIKNKKMNKIIFFINKKIRLFTIFAKPKLQSQ